MNANIITKMKLFLNTLDNFLNFVQDTFPEFESDILITKQAVNLAKNSNPRVVIENFMYYILPYSKQISECDEGFFLNFDNLKPSNISESNVMFAMKLKDIWVSDSITTEQKAQIWLYFQRLLKFGNNIM
jgi:hypothetical protein